MRLGSLLLGSLTGVCVAGGLAPPAAAQGFGLWAVPLQQCRITIPGQPERSCSRLRLEQKLEGVLSVAFQSFGEGGPLASQNLTFAGTLAPGQQPLRCRTDGRCDDPPQPLLLRVNSVAWSRFDGRGLASALPQARLAQGLCRLHRQDMRCEARTEEQAASPWKASALLGP